MGAVDTTYTFTATDTITSTKMNNIIDQTTMTSDAIIGTTLEVASGKLKVRSQGITSNEMATGSVTSNAILDGTIVNADINASAAIAGTKITPNFGSQNIVTTGALSTNVGSVISGSSSTDGLRITQTGTGNSLVVEDSTNPDGTPFVVSNNGTIITGHSQQPSGNFAYSSTVSANGAKDYVINGQSTTSALTAAIRYSNNTTSSTSTANVILAKSNTETIGDHVAVLDNQPIGILGYFGSDGTNFVQGCAVSSSVDGSVATNSVPMRLVFSTRASGSTGGLSERMRITSSGDVGIGKSPTTKLDVDGTVTATSFVGPLTGNASSATTATTVSNGAITAAKLDGAQSGTAPIFGVRAWVNFDATKDSTGAVSSANTNRLIRASGNVSSVLKTANGVYTVTFTTALPDANFAVYGSVSDNGGTTGGTTNQFLNGYQASSSTATITTTTTGSNLGDYSHVSVCVIR